MLELKMKDETTKDIFVQAFRESNLIPILGAGFSKGLRARQKGVVPDGAELKNYMIRQIVQEKKGIEEEELKSEAFSTVAELFEKIFSNPDDERIKDYFYNNFTGIKLNRVNQLRFLDEIDWNYIYTLNIDTTIEDSNHNRWEVFYPNSDFDERNVYDGRKRLFKIHGDVYRFTKSLNYKEMILTESQYLGSLEKNKKFHDMLTADCENRNMLYIGCSLKDEIDIKYSVLSDKTRNFNQKNTYRIYVTSEKLSELKKEKLEGFNISHYIQLNSTEDYEMFYEFLVNCYEESCIANKNNIDIYRYSQLEKLDKNFEENIDYLANFGSIKDKVPYYYIQRELVKELKLITEKVNVIMGRRFVGKTLLAYNMLEYNLKYQRYYISSNESLDTKTIRELLNLHNALIVFDSDSIDDRNFIELLNAFEPENKNLICVFINTYSETLNLISYYLSSIHYPLSHSMIGKMSSDDIRSINKGLHALGISIFDERQNLLDNTLRIANAYDKKLVEEYAIATKEEIMMIVWLLAQNKMYYEEVVTLGLVNNYKEIIRKFSPFLQEEKCKRSELRKHSQIKIVCNGKLGLLQILNSYVYPLDSEMGEVVVKMRHEKICEAIYEIMYRFDKVDRDHVRKFGMVDMLNDIFSRKYSRSSVNYLKSKGKSGRNFHGAAGLIQKIYNYEKIQNLKADDPNYWLQRAKSVYYKNNSNKKNLHEGIKWAKKAEQDSLVKLDEGQRQYRRTVSNATIQIAMMYGKVVKIDGYNNITNNNSAVEYYYKGLSDGNNIEAAKSLIKNSKGTEDFICLVTQLVERPECISKEYAKERDFLLKVSIQGDLVYSS